jgi:hypothetical protein
MLNFFAIHDRPFDVETPDGLLAFQRKLSERITHRDTATAQDDAKRVALSGMKNVSGDYNSFHSKSSRLMNTNCSFPSFSRHGD